MQSSSLIFTSQERSLWARVVFGAFLIAWLYRWDSHVLLHQLQQPVLKYPYVDLTYWVAHYFYLPDFLVGNYAVALSVDLGILAAAIGAIVKPQMRVFPIVFSLLFAGYFLCFNTYGNGHTHCLVGFLLIGIPFWSNNKITQALLWEGLRYFTIFLYACAFLWKLKRGFMFSEEHAIAILQQNNAAYLLQNPKTLLAEFLRYLLSHPLLAHYLVNVGALIQGCFLLGFFTKKADKLLFVLPFLFHTTSYFLFDVVFWEIWVLQVSFWIVARLAPTETA